MRGALLAAALCCAAAHVARMPLADLRAYLRAAANQPSAGGGGSGRPGRNFRGKIGHENHGPPAFRIAHSRPVNAIVPVDTDAPDSPAYTSGPLPVVTYLPYGGNAFSSGTARPLAAGIMATIGTGSGTGTNGSNGHSNGSIGSNGYNHGSSGSNTPGDGSDGSNNLGDGSNGSNSPSDGSSGAPGDGSNGAPDNSSNGSNTPGDGSHGAPDGGNSAPGDSAGGSSDSNSGSGNAINHGTGLYPIDDSGGSNGTDSGGSNGTDPTNDSGNTSGSSPGSPSVIPHGSGVDPAPANTDSNAQISDGDAVVFATDPESTETQIPSTYLGVPLDQTWRREISSTTNQTDDHADNANSASQSQGQEDVPGYVPVTGAAPAAQLGGRCADFAGIPPALLPEAVARVFTSADIPHYDTQDRCNTYL